MDKEIAVNSYNKMSSAYKKDWGSEMGTVVWMTLKDTVLTETNQSQKDNYSMTTYGGNLNKSRREFSVAE